MLAQSVHARHRREFMAAMGPNSAALIGSPPEVLRNGDADYRYRQSSDLYYLSGFAEPEATIVLRPDAAEPYVLFVRPKDPEREIWDGRRVGTEGAVSQFGADRALPSAELRGELARLIANVDDLYYELGVYPEYDEILLSVLGELRRGERRGLRSPKRIIDPRLTLHELRLHKSREEIEVLRRAAEITREGHLESMRTAAPGMGENEIEALLNYTFRRRGGMGPGYNSIVGGGENATILHYTENESELKDGELLLIDAGCEYDFYTADVTRTFPINGRFSEVQKRCYQVVLDAHLEAVAMTRPGVTMEELHDRCVEKLTAGMIELGLLQGSVEACIKSGAYRKFYMHRSSHWLGLDVHDVGAYTSDGKRRPLEPGMVLTVEPGMYIAADAEDVPAEFRGIGIRLEDDILVTEDGYENLTSSIPLTIADIEAACQR